MTNNRRMLTNMIKKNMEIFLYMIKKIINNHNAILLSLSTKSTNCNKGYGKVLKKSGIWKKKTKHKEQKAELSFSFLAIINILNTHDKTCELANDIMYFFPYHSLAILHIVAIAS